MALHSFAQVDSDGDAEMAGDEANSAAAKPKAKAQAKKAAAKARLLLNFAQLLIGDMSPRAGG